MADEVPPTGESSNIIPRHGKAEKQKRGTAAEFKPGKRAAKPKVFNVEKIADELKLYWENSGGDSFLVGSEIGENGESETIWNRWPKERLKSLLRKQYYVALKPRDGEFVSEFEQVLLHVTEKRVVDGFLWGLAGFGSGLHRMPSGEKIIVRNAPKPVQPQKGDCELLKELIAGRLDLTRDGSPYAVRTDQVTYFHAYHRCIYQSLLTGKPGSWTQRLFLVLAGPAGSGKTRLQMMITNGLLGGRVANPKAYLTGKDNFNANMIKAEHLMMGELDNVSQKMVDRLALSEAIKAIVANPEATLRLMRTDPMTIYPFWVPTLSMNDDPDKLRSFPPLSPDFRDKVLMLLVRHAPLPMATCTETDKQKFNEAISAQLPAYAWWLLNEFEIPQELLIDDHGKDASRFGFRAYQHASLAMELFDDTPAAELLHIIDAAEFTAVLGTGRKLWEIESESEQVGDLWEGTAIELEQLLLNDKGWKCSVEREAKKLCLHNKIDRLLSRLKEDEPNRVAQHRTKARRGWIISRPIE